MFFLFLKRIEEMEKRQLNSIANAQQRFNESHNYKKRDSEFHSFINCVPSQLCGDFFRVLWKPKWKQCTRQQRPTLVSGRALWNCCHLHSLPWPNLQTIITTKAAPPPHKNTAF